MSAPVPRTPRARRVDWVVLVALALDTAIAVVDAVTHLVMIGLVVCGPLLAALRSGWRSTALVSVYAFALAVYQGVPHGFFGTADHLARCAAIAVTGVFAVWGALLRERQERARRRAALLAEAGALLSAAVGYDATLRTVARVAVPALADWCAVEVTEPGGGVRNVATVHVDPGRLQALEDAWRDDPLARDGHAGVGGAVRTGRAEVYRAIPDERLGASAMVVPMVARGRMLGTVTFGASVADRCFDDEDLAFAQELTRRCALAVDNARLYEQRSRIAQTLQHSLLPSKLPSVPGLEVAVHFHAVGEDIEVGGDLVDLFDSGDGSWAAVIGDVSGKGAEAAAVTAMARYTVRTVAAREQRPSAVLAALNDQMLRHGVADDRFCTVAYARLSVGSRDTRVEMTCAGHPLPLLVGASGTVEVVGEPGMALGVVPAPRLADHELRLGPGDKLVFYTDGVIEARPPGGGVLGMDGLARLLEGCGELDSVATGEHIHRSVAGAFGEPRDDIAILVLRAVGDAERRGSEGLVRSGAVGRRQAMSVRVPGGPHAATAVRAALEGFCERGLTTRDAERANRLVAELASYCGRDGDAAGDGWIELEVEQSPDALRVEVSGPGARTPASDPVAVRPLSLVDEVADRWGTVDGGQRVWFELDRDTSGTRAAPAPI